jgi:hypothetical protein
MRPPPADNWDETLPAAERERYHVAWQSHRACRDCRNWSGDDGDGVGACDLMKYAAFLTPEDYTCDQFEPKSN